MLYEVITEQFETGVDPDTHVGGQHHRDLPGILGRPGLLLRGEPGRPADHFLAETGADVQVVEGDLGEGEIDEHSYNFV